ncbi:unnamed protein product, partial [Closterium sp. Naga37s-1]
STGAEPEEALHTTTLDSGASRCFFRDSTTVTPLTVLFPVTLADPSGGLVVARGATVLPCPAAPSGLLTGLHLPSFAKNLVATSVILDQWVTVTQPGGELEAICTDSALVPAPAPEVACTALPSLRQRAAARRSSLLLVSSHHCSSADPAHGQQGGCPRCLDRARFQQDLPFLQLHSDRGGEFCSHLLEDFCGAEGIVQLYILPASPQQNGIAECRIGLVMEVARTSMIPAAAPHFLWPFAVRYAAEQLNLWPRVSHPETSPTLRWTGEVGDASAFWV